MMLGVGPNSYGQKIRSKRRSLPYGAPGAERYEDVLHRDIGAMTPVDLNDNMGSSFEACTPVSATPLTTGSAFSHHSVFDGKSPAESLPVSRNCQASLFCKVLLLVSCIVAVMSSTLLVLFMFGIISNNNNFKTLEHVIKNGSLQQSNLQQNPSQTVANFARYTKENSVLPILTSASSKMTTSSNATVTSLDKKTVTKRHMRSELSPTDKTIFSLTHLIPTMMTPFSESKAAVATKPIELLKQTAQTIKQRKSKHKKERKQKCEKKNAKKRKACRNSRRRGGSESRKGSRDSFSTSTEEKPPYAISHMTSLISESRSQNVNEQIAENHNDDVIMEAKSNKVEKTINKGEKLRSLQLSLVAEEQRFPWTKVAANSEHADIYLQDASSSDETSDNIIDDGDIPSLKAALHGSENRCKKIHNQFCKTTLPYSTSRDRIVTAASLPMTSRMLLALKSGLLASSQNRTLSQCNLESASRFFCLVLYPQCIESEFPMVPPCLTWCIQVMMSCVTQSLLALLNNDAKQPNFFAKQKVLSTNDWASHVDGVCRNVINELTSKDSLSCIDLSYAKNASDSTATGKSTHEPNSFCTAAEFQCSNGVCIDARWRCDGYKDCEEEEDENGCECDFVEFECRSGQCVAQSRVCDGYFDCFDKSDEINCAECGTNLTSCGNNQCVFAAWWCDGDVDCVNGMDEKHCTCESRGLHSCSDRSCISRDSLCDGAVNCAGGEDEAECSENIQLDCSLWTMTCDRSCVSVTHQCDGIPDCADGKDEAYCGNCEEIDLDICQGLPYDVTMLPNFLNHLTQSEIRLSNEYLLLASLVQTRCHPLLRNLGCSLIAPSVPLVGASCPFTKKSERGRRALPCRSFCLEVQKSCTSALSSISMSWPAFLDCGNFPSANSSSEVCVDGNELNEGICSSDEFRCHSKHNDETQCVTMMSQCDGVEQCNDGSDEVDCDCERLNRFQCSDGRKCIDINWVCDSHRDCVDGSDEVDCSTSKCGHYGPCKGYTVALHKPMWGHYLTGFYKRFCNCTFHQRACMDYSCVNFNQWCDGNDDCSDGSDEMHCLALVSRTSVQNALLLPSDDKPRRSGVLVGFDFTKNKWSPICSHSWDQILSHMACHQIGFKDAQSFSNLSYNVPQGHKIRHQPISIGYSHRVRRVQEAFVRRETTCPSYSFVHIHCRSRTCGTRYDPTYAGRKMTRILGGKNSRANKWPWLASLQLQGLNHVCGATLVRPRWLISAAHCFQERKMPSIWRVKIFSIGTLRSASSFNISKIIIHSRYDSQAVDFDVALLRLEGAIRASEFDSLCLPTSSFNQGSFCVIAGWGITGKSPKGSRKLKEGKVHVLDRQRCQQFYPNHLISERMICAGLNGIVDACSGDSGGPLMCWQPHQLQWQLAGITSWGSSCTPHSAPGVYTNMRYFAEWAEKIMDENLG